MEESLILDSNLKRINTVRNRLRFRNRNLNYVNRRKNKLQNRKKKSI